MVVEGCMVVVEEVSVLVLQVVDKAVAQCSCQRGSWGKRKVSIWNVAMTVMPLQESCPGQTYKA